MRRRSLLGLLALLASGTPEVRGAGAGGDSAGSGTDARGSAPPPAARGATPAAATTPAPEPRFAAVERGVPLVFPRDFGAHPAFRTEWWYITGWLEPQSGAAEPLGFQITFFRSRPRIDPRNPSRFAARQLVLAHIALSDRRRGTLVHAERSAREGFDLAGAREGDTDVWIDDWRLQRSGATQASRYQASFPGDALAFDLQLAATQPLLLHGVDGFSQKGPAARQASYYYTQPQLAVSGHIVHESRRLPVRGRAWFDHEWSSEILADGAVGWDWAGLNLDDGSALMVFRIRDRNGSALWAGGTFRPARGAPVTLGPRAITFTALREWRSARTGARYPVAVRVAVPAQALAFDLLPLFDDQELDARASTGIVYWEGAVSVQRAAAERGTSAAGADVVGRGYLELTGYQRALSL
jgi:predicted secreted hydrolase